MYTRLRILIAKILADGHLISRFAGESHLHKNGFLALTLDSDNKSVHQIHWYLKGTDAISDIHSHPWNFESTIHMGCLRISHYREGELEMCETVRLERYVCRSLPNLAGYRFSLPRQVTLSRISVFDLVQGSSYQVHQSEIHAVQPLVETITEMHIFQRGDISLVYAKNRLDSFNNRYLRPQEYERYLKEILWRLQ